MSSFHPCLSFLPRPVRTTLAQLRSGHCRLLKLYMARITTGVSDVCPECGVALHSVEHLFNCSAHPTQLTVQDLWDNRAEVADFLNLDSWRQWTRREELLGYHNNNCSWLLPTGLTTSCNKHSSKPRDTKTRPNTIKWYRHCAIF